jgi:hypothetical protein
MRQLLRRFRGLAPISLAFERARLPKAVLPRLPLGGRRTKVKTARSGLLRTHSPSPSAVGVAVARLKSLLQLLQRDFRHTSSRPRTRPTQRFDVAMEGDLEPRIGDDDRRRPRRHQGPHVAQKARIHCRVVEFFSRCTSS